MMCLYVSKYTNSILGREFSWKEAALGIQTREKKPTRLLPPQLLKGPTLVHQLLKDSAVPDYFFWIINAKSHLSFFFFKKIIERKVSDEDQVFLEVRVKQSLLRLSENFLV